MTITLAEVVADLGPDVVLHGDASVEVSSVVHDSRAARPGSLFCCVPGSVVDGHAHAAEAVSAGAVALLCERALTVDVAQAVVADVRASMGPVASTFHGYPSRQLQVVGVTGTNGKTTTVAFLEAILEHAGRSTGVIGTLSGPRTTPDATDLQAELAEMRDAGRVAVAMEVSSHAMALDRVLGTRFALAAFTNLGHDHLDFHGTTEAYFAAKARLFEPDLTDRAVVNVDDPHGRLLRDAARVPTTSCSLADVDELVVGPRSSAGRWRGQRLYVPMGGQHNVANAVVALTVAGDLDVDPATAVDGLAAARQVPGRLEPVDEGQAYTVLIDFAHTPDGLEQALRAARSAGGRVLVVFGAGGDKDREKRPLMGAVAARFADVVVVTSDNPRGEDPMTIIDAVVEGIERGTVRERVRVEPDRRAAIALALGDAQPGDVVVIAGKGHETVQESAGHVVAFDDRAVVRELLR